MRRAADALVAATALTLLSPILAGVGIAIRVLDGRPVLFRQWRSGRGGRPFQLVKFRTMRTGDHAGPDQDAARTTRLGRFLRSTSLDELPELVNVVRGEMALVGPRPLPIAYLDRYDDQQARRLEVRPGVTGWAQINGRNATTWDERLALDTDYVERRSLRLDARIIARTVGQVLRRQGVDHGEGVTMPEFRGPHS